jgi:hypothetical protein
MSLDFLVMMVTSEFFLCLLGPQHKVIKDKDKERNSDTLQLLEMP